MLEMAVYTSLKAYISFFLENVTTFADLQKHLNCGNSIQLSNSYIAVSEEQGRSGAMCLQN
jgi:hypothetical protein